MELSTLLPIAGGLGIAACTAFVSGLVGLVIKRMGNQDRQLSQIHLLVNSRMGEAQADILRLKEELLRLNGVIATLTTALRREGIE